MNDNDFKNIMRNAFRVEYEGEESECRCFECGELSELVRISREWSSKWKMMCKNNHQYDLIDWLILHIDARDGIAKVILRGDCNYNPVRVD